MGEAGWNPAVPGRKSGTVRVALVGLKRLKAARRTFSQALPVQ